MKKNNNKAYAVGWLVLILAIVGAVILGQVRKDRYVISQPEGNYALEQLPTKEYRNWIDDAAGVLSSATEEQVC